MKPSAVIYIRVPVDLKSQVEQYAQRQGMTQAHAVGELLRWGLNSGIENELARWSETVSARDSLVRKAVAAGVSKNRIYVLTGIARTTIDRIVDADG